MHKYAGGCEFNLPHVRGDVPVPARQKLKINNVYPAFVGMNRLYGSMCYSNLGLPRERGDEPAIAGIIESSITPQAWGCTRSKHMRVRCRVSAYQPHMRGDEPNMVKHAYPLENQEGAPQLAAAIAFYKNPTKSYRCGDDPDTYRHRAN